MREFLPLTVLALKRRISLRIWNYSLCDSHAALPATKYPASFRYLVGYLPREHDGEVLDFQEITGKGRGRPS